MFTPYHEGDPNFLNTLGDFCSAWLTESGDANYNDSFDAVDDNVIDMKDFSYWASHWDIPTGYETDWYYLTDALGSVRGLVGGRYKDSDDYEFYNYDVYGKLSIQNGEESQSGNVYLFAAMRFDPEAGFYYTSNRTYSPPIARWLQMDIKGYVDGMNLYEYVASNPIMYIDPFGTNLYAVDGTWSKKMADTGIATNVRRFHDYYMSDAGPKVGSGKYYCHGPGAVAGGVQGAGSRSIYKSVKKRICDDWCDNSSVHVNLVGWSRGAVIAMEVAEELEDDGCECKTNQKCGHPSVNWMGLFDAVDMMNYIGGPILGNPNPFHGVGFTHSIPSNVEQGHHIIKTEKPINIGWPKLPFKGIIQPNKQLLFPTVDAQPEDPSKTRFTSEKMSWDDGRKSTHGDIGTGDYFLEAMMKNAESAGLKFNWIRYTVDTYVTQ